MEIKLAFTADIVPAKQAAIFSKVSGYIRRIHADRGDFVKAGQVLVEVDDLELQASAIRPRRWSASSQAGLEMARSTLEGNRANIENQRANLAKARAVADNDARQAVRMKTLFERGLVSATDFENARTNAESSQANVQSAEAQLRRRGRPDRHRREPGPALAGPARDQSGGAGARADQSREHEAARAVRRLRRPAKPGPGAAVSAQSAGTNTSSVGILMLHDIETVKVQIEVPERDISRVRVGAPVRLTVDPYRGEASGARSPGSCTTSTRARARWAWRWRSPNPGRKLKPGMFARVEVLVETRAGRAHHPAEALRLGERKPVGDGRPGRRRRGGARRARSERRARRRGAVRGLSDRTR